MYATVDFIIIDLIKLWGTRSKGELQVEQVAKDGMAGLRSGNIYLNRLIFVIEDFEVEKVKRLNLQTNLPLTFSQ